MIVFYNSLNDSLLHKKVERLHTLDGYCPRGYVCLVVMSTSSSSITESKYRNSVFTEAKSSAVRYISLAVCRGVVRTCLNMRKSWSALFSTIVCQFETTKWNIPHNGCNEIPINPNWRELIMLFQFALNIPLGFTLMRCYNMSTRC